MENEKLLELVYIIKQAIIETKVLGKNVNIENILNQIEKILIDKIITEEEMIGGDK
jgi:hypothetical protein